MRSTIVLCAFLLLTLLCYGEQPRHRAFTAPHALFPLPAPDPANPSSLEPFIDETNNDPALPAIRRQIPLTTGATNGWLNTGSIQQVWSDEVHDWVNVSKSEYILNARGSTMGYYRYTWVDSAWVYLYNFQYTRDSLNRVTASVQQNWSDSDGVYENIQKNSYFFDANGDNIALLVYQWLRGDWYCYAQYSMIYNNHHLINEALEVPINNGWTNYQQVVYTYDFFNRETSEVVQTWSSSANEWKNYTSTAYAFDSVGNRTLQLSRIWQGYWFNQSQIVSSYDSLRAITHELHQDWQADAWRNTVNYDYYYDNHHRSSWRLKSIWNNGSSVWVNQSKDILSRDPIGLEIEDLTQVWRDGAWVDSARVNYSWQEILGVAERSIPAAQFRLLGNYPNPFNPSTTIRYALPNATEVTIKVYSLLGQEVATIFNGRQDAGEKTVVFNAAGLPSGVYFYGLTASGVSEMKRMALIR